MLFAFFVLTACNAAANATIPTPTSGHSPDSKEYSSKSCADCIVSGFNATVPHWNDTNGNRIEAHAAGMFQDPTSHRWFWYGESKKTSDLADHGVNCYSSASIAGPWTFVGQVIAQKDLPEKINGQEGPFIVERPKVLYNTKTKKYVCWFHLDTSNYKYRHSAVFQSDSPTGPFEFVHALQPDGIPSLDMSLFQDPIDGQAYLIRSCNNEYAGISRLSADYLNTTGLISSHSKFEGMALFRHPNGLYHISHLPPKSNPLMLFRAEGKTLDDPQWVNLGNPTNSQTSFNSQPTYVVSYQPPSGNPYFVYMSDNWIHGGKGLVDATYIWLPFKFSEDGVSLPYLSSWSLTDPFGD